MGYKLRGLHMSDFAIGRVSPHEVKSKQFGFDAMFPRKNIDDMFREYFTKNSTDDGFIDLHGELQKLDLRT